MGDKKSVVLLTVVAVATLLVAVVGASFAFFAANTENVNGKVEVSAETAAGSDIFSSAGVATIGLKVTNDVMLPQNSAGNPVAVEESTSDEDYTGGKLVVSLKAGSGVATCTYKLKYVDVEADDTTEPKTKVYTPTENMTEGMKEYTLEGTDGTNSFSETNMDKVAATLAGKTFTISNTAGSATTNQTWDFTARFYNLSITQDDQINSRFAGTVTVDPDSISCSNSGN
ncbi:MAG: hypothetical protein IJN03_01185 [Bacilli bacterium]|nr:hypothetical protein [Bacilli bacterium]